MFVMFRRVTLFLLIHFLYCSSLPAATPRGDDRIMFNVRSYGAAGDGITNDRAALQRAIDSCARTGGTVWFPPGKYLTGSLELYDDVELYVGRGATILGSTNLRDYREYVPNIPSYNDLFLRHSLLYAEGKHNISLRGEGTIDGQGSAFLVTTKVKPDRYKNRPFVIRFVGCKNVTVRDVTLQNSAMWMQQYLACEDVEIRGIRVYNHANLNNDMIDIDGCRNVVMADCIGDTEDDAITLKSTSPFITENVTITNCVVSSHCNAIKTGTESTGGFRNIAVSNIVIKPSAVSEGRVGYPGGISGITLAIVDGGVLDGITISNILIDGPQVPLFLRLGNRARKFTENAKIPGFGSCTNISIQNVTAVNAGAIGCLIAGIPGHPVENITLSNITVTFAGGGTMEDARRSVAELEDEYPESTRWGPLPAYGFTVRHARNVVFNSVACSYLARDLRPALFADDVDRITLTGFRAQGDGDADALVRLTNTRQALVQASQPTTKVGCFLRAQGGIAGGTVILANDLTLAATPFIADDPSTVRSEGNILPR
jgi:hypothetical protein